MVLAKLSETLPLSKAMFKHFGQFTKNKSRIGLVRLGRFFASRLSALQLAQEAFDQKTSMDHFKSKWNRSFISTTPRERSLSRWTWKSSEWSHSWQFCARDAKERRDFTTITCISSVAYRSCTASWDVQRVSGFSSAIDNSIGTCVDGEGRLCNTTQVRKHLFGVCAHSN